MKASQIVGISWLLLTGCVRTDISSVALVKDGYATESLRKASIEQVYEKAQNMGGSCREISSQYDRHRCTFGGSNPQISINVGENSAGQFLVAVDFTYLNWFPPSRDAVLSGKYINAQQIELESWLRGIFPSSSVDRVVRRYGSYDLEQPL